MNETKLVPKLRFKEFTDEWNLEKLGEISTVKDGTHDSPKYISEGYPLITSKNLLENSIDFENVNYISKEDYGTINKRSNVDVGDILFGMIGTIGNPVIVKSDNFAIKNVALIKEKEDLLNSILIQILETDFIKKQFYRLNAGGTQKFIALSLIRDLLVPVPLIKEQFKLSDYFLKIDKKLDLLNQQLIKTQDFKKGLMQQIFTQKIRFDGFGDEWKSYNLNDLFSSVKGKGLSKDDIDENGVNKCVLYGELYTTYNELIKEVVSKTDNDEGVLSQKGDILVPCSTTTSGEDLVTASVLFEDNVLLGGDISILRNKNKIPLDEMFFAYYFDSALKKDVYRLTQGSTIIHLYWKDFKKVEMKLPSIEEQKLIAQILLTLDKKISLIQNQISQMKQFKKGLLQQMFI